MAEILTSVGSAGEMDLERSEGRAYQTLAGVVAARRLLETSHQTLEAAATARGRRRMVLRAEISPEVALEAVSDSDLPIEALIPLSSLGESDNYIIYVGRNVHESEVPNLLEVQNYWNQEIELRMSPLDRIFNLSQEYCMSSNLRLEDSQELHDLWRPFGWRQQQIVTFIQSYRDQPNLWFSGVRAAVDNRLVSACMGESLRFGNTLMVEGTEYSTHPDHEGRGLCAAAVAGLNAQVLNDTLYSTGEMPLITAEFDLSSRSDVVGRKVGMVVPQIDQAGVSMPDQVLRSNVSVLDRRPPNNLRWRSLGEQRHHYRDAYRTTYNYWRNFVVGILPRTSVEAYYPQDQVAYITKYLVRQ